MSIRRSNPISWDFLVCWHRSGSGVAPREEEEPDGSSTSGSSGEEVSPSAALVGEEQRYEGTVARFTEAELVLEDDTAFVIDTNTESDGALAQGMDVRVRAVMYNGILTATGIEVR